MKTGAHTQVPVPMAGNYYPAFSFGEGAEKKDVETGGSHQGLPHPLFMSNKSKTCYLY